MPYTLLKALDQVILNAIALGGVGLCRFRSCESSINDNNHEKAYIFYTIKNF